MVSSMTAHTKAEVCLFKKFLFNYFLLFCVAFDYLNEQNKYVRWCVGLGLFQIISCNVHTDSECWEIQILGAQNPKMTDLKEGTYSVKLPR